MRHRLAEPVIAAETVVLATMFVDYPVAASQVLL
ncbi:hypothetical protein GGR03_000346 [Aurantimonas endophytica]|uniref:Uncharacterized protein n=1 Tax=Aurantimonas endophytica TaxID=1522175 RepID=A0A7W6H9V8_9HYPH|nr:hypothetical protein [Aurantimonas endophytica]